MAQSFFLENILKISRFSDTIQMYNYVKRGLDNGSEKEDNANSHPAGHNSALFPVKSKVAYSFKAYSARSETGGVRLVYLSALLPLQQGGEGG